MRKRTTKRMAFLDAMDECIAWDESSRTISRASDVVYGDSGYLGLQKRPEIRDNKNKAKIDFRINRRPSQFKTSDT